MIFVLGLSFQADAAQKKGTPSPVTQMISSTPKKEQAKPSPTPAPTPSARERREAARAEKEKQAREKAEAKAREKKEKAEAEAKLKEERTKKETEKTPANGDEAVPAAKETNYFAVKTERTPLYSVGPAQAGPPDRWLRKDTTVVMVQKGRGYSRVTADDDFTGWVSTRDLKPIEAPMETEAEEFAPSAGSGRSSRKPSTDYGTLDDGSVDAGIIDANAGLEEMTLPESPEFESPDVPAFRF